MEQQTSARATTASPDSEALHLRRVIESQPAVLMRVGLDGAMLAANMSALGLLGAEDPNQLADLSLSACVVPEHRERWTAFAAAIGQGASNSFECEFTNLVGTSRTIVFHGVPLIDHPDCIPSIIVSAHDVSVLRRSEAAHENKGASGRASMEPSHHADTQEPQDRIYQLERLLRDGRNHLLDLRTKLEQAHAEARALAEQLTEREGSLQQSMLEQAVLRDALSARERDHADTAGILAEHERAAAEGALRQAETEHRAKAQLDNLRAECSRLAELLEDRERELQTLAEQHESVEDRLRIARAEREQLDTLVHERSAELEVLKRDHEIVVAERDELQARLARSERECCELSARLEPDLAARKHAEDSLAKTRLELESLDEATKQLLPRVSAGRLALEVSDELTQILGAIDTRIASLLAQIEETSSTHHELRTLRADATLARLLSREILLSCDRGNSAPVSRETR